MVSTVLHITQYATVYTSEDPWFRVFLIELASNVKLVPAAAPPPGDPFGGDVGGEGGGAAICDGGDAGLASLSPSKGGSFWGADGETDVTTGTCIGSMLPVRRGVGSMDGDSIRNEGV